MVTSTTTMGENSLVTKSIEDLRIIASQFGAEIKENATAEDLITAIELTNKYNPINEGNSTPSVVVEGKRVHPVHGEYRSVILHPTAGNEQNTSIFLSVNNYTVEVQPRTKVSLPKGIIKFAKQSTRIEHYFDRNAVSENGNVGAHLSREVPNYIVEIADLDD